MRTSCSAKGTVQTARGTVRAAREGGLTISGEHGPLASTVLVRFVQTDFKQSGDNGIGHIAQLLAEESPALLIIFQGHTGIVSGLRPGLRPCTKFGRVHNETVGDIHIYALAHRASWGDSI